MTLSDHLDQLGLTQAQFGRLLKHLGGSADRGTVNRWVHGKIKTRSSVLAFAAALQHVPKETIQAWLEASEPL